MYVLRGRSIILILLLVIGLVFLFLGFKGESWFQSEPASTVVVEELPDGGKVKTMIPKEEAKIVEKMEGLKFFAEYRLERDRTRSQQVEILEEITKNNKTTEETRAEAQKKLMKLVTNLEKEVELENLIRAKNFKDAVVFIQDTSVTVIVLSTDLTEKDTDLISQMVARSTGVSRENVILIPKS